MSFDLLKPELYSRTQQGEPTLKGGRCSACGHAFFPMQIRGCERCGRHGDALEQVDLGGAGRLVAASTVHMHAGKSRTAPFVIGVIDLDSGPRIRTLLEGMPDADRRTDERVRALLVEAPDRDGAPALDLRFGPA